MAWNLKMSFIQLLALSSLNLEMILVLANQHPRMLIQVKLFNEHVKHCFKQHISTASQQFKHDNI